MSSTSPSLELPHLPCCPRDALIGPVSPPGPWTVRVNPGAEIVSPMRVEEIVAWTPGGIVGKSRLDALDHVLLHPLEGHLRRFPVQK